MELKNTGIECDLPSEFAKNLQILRQKTGRDLSVFSVLRLWTFIYTFTRALECLRAIKSFICICQNGRERTVSNAEKACTLTSGKTGGGKKKKKVPKINITSK